MYSPARGRPARLVIIVACFLAYFFVYDPFGSTYKLDSADNRAVRFIKSSYDWSQYKHKHPVPHSAMARLPSGVPRALPNVQYSFPPTAYDTNPDIEIRRNAVRDAFHRCWRSYREHAWLYDELTPITLRGKNTFGGWAATLVDALDSLLIMGFWDEFRAALPAVAALDWGNTTESSVNVFETTIRHLGGLLSAYDLSGERILLLKAIELGDMLYAAFDTPNRIPGFWLNFQNAREGTQEAGTHDPSASPCSLSLEFTRLAQLTGNAKYFDAVDRIKQFLERTQMNTTLPGMWPTFLDFRSERADVGSDYTLGALADSLYEYLPKMTALLAGRDASYEVMYRDAMDVVERRLLFRPMVPDNADILFSGDAKVVSDQRVLLNAEGQHLGCFVGGMFGLGGRLYGIEKHVNLGERLARGCAWAYAAFPSGVMPEIFGMVPCPTLDKCPWEEERWKEAAVGSTDLLPLGFSHARDPRYILRPEAAESLFLLYRMTGKEEFRDAAWQMFQAIMRATKTGRANSAIRDVTAPAEHTEKMDEMESFWLAETLKYFYLIFSPPDVISLDEYVFNTEAHPLKRPRK
ncbi:family 47 glycosyl hydrolase [Thozetella sp. PMI_491]|nr:family 47 glycosyl hydrolase [Thozetella sp. PMI_491]